MDNVDYQAMIEGRESDLDFVAKSLNPIFSAFDHVCDVPVPALYRQLAYRFPDARFIALRRSPRSWVSSIRRHIGARAFDPFEKVIYWAYFKDRPTSIVELSDDRLIKFHKWHHRSLVNFFAGADNFLLLSLKARGIGASICDFCDLPRIPFRQIDYALGHDVVNDPELVPARITE
jgi:hypothetical protein